MTIRICARTRSKRPSSFRSVALCAWAEISPVDTGLLRFDANVESTTSIGNLVCTTKPLSACQHFRTLSWCTIESLCYSRESEQGQQDALESQVASAAV